MSGGWRFLPEGVELLGRDETALWQGRPTTAGFARRLFHVRAITGYFVVLAAWNLMAAHADGYRASDAMVASFWVVIPAIAAAGLLYGMAFLFAKTSHYMITDKRIIMQVGVAFPVAVTVPLAKIASADMKLYPDGTGDLTVAFNSDDQLAYLLLWPHARPWRFKRPEPMLRSIQNAHAVAALLAKALSAASTGPSVAPAIDMAGAPQKQTEPAMVVA